MLTVAAFASLAQLGSGLALALSIFSEPITNREAICRRKLENNMLLLPNRADAEVIDRRNDIYRKIFDLDEALKDARTEAKAPIAIIKIAAFVNFLVLLWATVWPDYEVGERLMWLLLIVLVAPVAIGVLWLEHIAQTQIMSLPTD